jgi:molecular chaperone GrpE
MRTDERFGLLQPVVVDLCALRNDLLRQAATLPADLSVERMRDLLESFAASIEDALLRCGVEPQARDVGVPFVPRRQRVARVVETDDPERDGTVAEIVQDGYAEIDDGRVVVPARVAVHRAAGPVKDPNADMNADTNATKEHVDA